MFNFDLQRFGGGTSVVQAPAQVTPMSPEQQRAVQLQNQYIEKTGPVLANLVDRGSAALDAYQAPDFSKFYQYGLDVTQDASNQAKRLAQGYMPTAYKANMDAVISEALAPYQQQFNSLAGSGVINSTLGKNWAADMAKAGQTAANLAYNQNLTSASNLNQIYGQTATAPLGYQNTYYQTATQPAKDFLSLGTATYQPTGQAASAAQQWQAQLSSPASSTVVQNQSPFGSILGSVAGAATGKLWK